MGAMTSEVIDATLAGADDVPMTTDELRTSAPHPAPGAVPLRDATVDPIAGAAPLRRVLRLNAATSGLAGALMIVVADRFDAVLGTGAPGWIRVVGVGLVLFAGGLVLLAGRSVDVLARLTPSIVAADAAWVLASVITILLGWYSRAGAIAVGVVAAAVGAFAVAQHRSWLTLRRPVLRRR